MAPQIAWIGLGNIGRGMAKNLVEKGGLTSPVLVYNRTTSKATAFVEKIGNSSVASTINEAVSKADIIFTCLSDDKAIDETISTALEAGNIKGKLFVDCSTVHPDTTSRISKTVQSHKASFVACPVFGAPAMAEAGALICVLAGPKDAVDRVKPYCTGVMGKAIIDFSNKEPAKATLLKILGNTFVLSMVNTISEGLVLAEKTGLGTDELQSFIEAVFPGPYPAYSNRMRSGDYYKRADPLFAVDLARKDVRHALDLAKKSGANMKGTELAEQRLAVVKEHMGTRGDVASMYGAVRKEADLKFEN